MVMPPSIQMRMQNVLQKEHLLIDRPDRISNNKPMKYLIFFLLLQGCSIFGSKKTPSSSGSKARNATFSKTQEKVVNKAVWELLIDEQITLHFTDVDKGTLFN